MQSIACLGHTQREERRIKASKLLTLPQEHLPRNVRVWIRKGPISLETSLKELDDTYESTKEWKLIEDGGVVSVPVEEFRMMNPPQPGNFGRSSGGKGSKIEHYTVGETVEHLNARVLSEFDKEKQKLKANGKAEAEAERMSATVALKLPLFSALKAWQDIEAEIKLKRATEDMMTRLQTSAFIIRSVNLKAISALRDLGLKLTPGDAEIDLLMAYVSGDFLHINIFEVKRADTFPWQSRGSVPNKQAINKAENQLSKDLDILVTILAGIPPNQIIFETFACFPDNTISELQSILCECCLKENIVCQDDLADLSLLQKKTKVPDSPDQATTIGKQNLLTLSARLLSHQSLLHIGYREVEDKEKLVVERHSYNIESVDKKILHKEFVVASPQQQQIITSFTSSLNKRHLVLEGPAGTGKTLVALQAANSLLESITDMSEGTNRPVLIVTACDRNQKDPLMQYLDASTKAVHTNNKTLNGWINLLHEMRVSTSDITPGCGWSNATRTFQIFGKSGLPGLPEPKMKLHLLTQAVAKKWEGRQVVMLVDEVSDREIVTALSDHGVPESIRIILALNPEASPVSLIPLVLHPSFLHVALTVPYRSTIAITSLARFIANTTNLSVPTGGIGSDVLGTKPILICVSEDDKTMEEALTETQKVMSGGRDVIALYDMARLPDAVEQFATKEAASGNGFLWKIHHAEDFYGWESDNIVALTEGGLGEQSKILEMTTRARINLCRLSKKVRYIDSICRSQIRTQLRFTKGIPEKVIQNLVKTH